MLLEHVVIQIDVSPAVDALFARWGGIGAQVIDALQKLTVDKLTENHSHNVPDINGLYVTGFSLGTGDDIQDMVTLAKPRRYQPSIGRVGWALAFVMDAEYSAVNALPEDERNNALVSMLGISGDRASLWTAVYGAAAT